MQNKKEVFMISMIGAIFQFFFNMNLRKIKCPSCGKTFKAEVDEQDGSVQCPYCKKIWGI